MKVYIEVTDDHGGTFEGNANLVRLPKSAKARHRGSSGRIAMPPTADVSFSLNERAFMKKYAKGVSGPRKFVLLLARLVQGKIGQEVSGERIDAAWNRMTEVSGEYNSAYGTRAKTEGWIDSPKRGHFTLAPSWKEALSGE